MTFILNFNLANLKLRDHLLFIFMKLGYIRSNHHDDFYKKQLNMLTDQGCDRIFEDLDDTSELEHLLDYARPEDKIIVSQMDRLGLNIKDLMNFVYDLIQRNIHFKSLDEEVDTSTPEGRVFLKIFNALAICEKNSLKEDPIKSDKIRSFPESRSDSFRLGGRPKGLTQQAREKAGAAVDLYKNSALSMREIANNLNISTATLYSYLRHEKAIE